MADLTQTRIGVGLAEELTQGGHQRFVTLARTVLQVEVKAVGHTEFGHGGQLEHKALRVLKGGREHQPKRAHHHGFGRRGGVLAFGPVLELDKAHGVVLAGTGKGEAAHRKDVLHVLGFVGAHHLLEAVGHKVRALGRGRGGRLHHHQQHALVFVGHEGARDLHKAQNHGADQHGVQNKQTGDAAHEHAHRGAHAVGEGIKGLVEPAEKAQGGAGVVLVDLLEKRGAKRGDERQGHHHGQGHGRDDRHGELTIDHACGAAEEGHRHEHGRQHHGDADQRARDLSHRLDGGRLGIAPFFHHHALDVFDHHNGVVHQQTDGQHQGEHREHVDRVAHELKNAEGAQQHHRHRNRRDDRGAPVLQKEEHHAHDEHNGFNQGLDHFVHGRAHERGRVERNHVLDALGVERTQLVELGLHAGGRFQSVGAGTQLNGHARRRLAVKAALEGIAFLPQADGGHVLDAHDRTVGQRLEGNLLELLGGVHERTGADRGRDHALAVGRLPGDVAGGHLDVLRLNGGDHIARLEAVLAQQGRIHPDAHGVGSAEHGHFTHAFQTRQGLFDVVGQKVAQVTRGELSGRIDEAHHLQERGRALLHLHAELTHGVGQVRFGHRELVLHLHLRNVGVGARLEGQGNGHATRRVRGRAHVDEPVQTGHVLFDHLRDRSRHGFGRGARVGGRHGHLRRRDVRILGNREVENGQCARQHDGDGDHPCEDRTIDKETTKHALSSSVYF